MEPSDTWLALAAIVASLMIADDARSESIDFEDLVLDTRYFDGETFVSAGVSMTLSNVGGHIDVQALGQAGGTGNELEFFGGAGGGVSLAFDFGADVGEVSLLYGEYGGTLNLLINGDSVIVGSFVDLPPTLGGVDITMTGGQSGLGTLSFDGVISSFAIGGQEFVLDNVSYQPIPGPGVLSIVGMGVAAATARRRRRRRTVPRLRGQAAEPHLPSRAS